VALVPAPGGDPGDDQRGGGEDAGEGVAGWLQPAVQQLQRERADRGQRVEQRGGDRLHVLDADLAEVHRDGDAEDGDHGAGRDGRAQPRVVGQRGQRPADADHREVAHRQRRSGGQPGVGQPLRVDVTGHAAESTQEGEAEADRGMPGAERGHAGQPGDRPPHQQADNGEDADRDGPFGGQHRAAAAQQRSNQDGEGRPDRERHDVDHGRLQVAQRVQQGEPGRRGAEVEREHVPPVRPKWT
jgi:hypothetical protein